ncbi:acetyl-CoA acetyltransferase [Iodidimonas sp. SYSU 1G8]|uniref:acetyl-CoA acetyltransferase n=1 Tax=Iodidimonas sp. SYSU 1G8 TaxID=3133967 RepID=UPI0031FEF63F
MEDTTPILVGAGQFTEKGVSPEKAHPPMGIAAEAAKAAMADTGLGAALAPHICTLAMIRIFPDSTNRPRMVHGFGRAENPPRAIARRIGAKPRHAIYSQVGGNTPQKLISEMCERIVAGDVSMALIAGAEAIQTTKDAARLGLTLDWQEEDEGSLDDRGIGSNFVTAHEFAHGIGIPIQTYPLFENVIRGKQGHSVEQHLQAMGALFAPFTRVAARNPYSFYGTERSAEELATPGGENRYISFPYPRWMNAMDGVNQGSAVILTSVGKARELGIPPSNWVFIHGVGEAVEKLVSFREDYSRAPAMRLSGRKALDMAGIGIDQIDFIDLYSCFPSAVEVACDELGLAYDDPRGLTVTGGLPFFGGPGNSYSLNAIAAMQPLLRGKPGSYGLIGANGGYLSKQGTGIYSTTPTEGTWARENPASYQGEIDGLPDVPFTETPSGSGTIETYTVCFGRGGPERGIVIGRLGDGTRFIANTPTDAATLNGLMDRESLGRPGTVTSAEGRNVFTPD